MCFIFRVDGLELKIFKIMKKMKALILITLLSLVACGQVEIGIVDEPTVVLEERFSGTSKIAISYLTTPPDNVRHALANWIIDPFVASGDWDEMDYFAIASDTEANWIDLIHGLATTPTACTFTAYNGWQANGGVGDHLSTGFIRDNYTQDTVFFAAGVLLVDSATSSGDTNYMFGIGGGNQNTFINERNTADNIQYRAISSVSGTMAVPQNMENNRLYSVSRTNTTDIFLKKGNTTLDTEARSSTSNNLDTEFILLNKADGTGGNTNIRIGAAFVGRNVDLAFVETQILIFRALVQYSPEAQDVLSRIPNLLTIPQWKRDEIAEAVDGMQNIDFFRHLRGFYALNLGDSTLAYRDWIRDSVGVSGGGITLSQHHHIKGGVDGSNKWWNTKFNPTVDARGGGTNIGMFVWIDGADTQDLSNRTVAGVTDGSTAFQFRTIFPDEVTVRINDAAPAQAFEFNMSQGQLWVMRREGGITKTIRIANQILGESDDAVTTVPNKNIYALAENHNDSIEWESDVAIKYIGWFDANPNLDYVGLKSVLKELSDTLIAKGVTDGTPPATTPVIAFNSKNSTQVTVDVTTPSTDPNPGHINVYHDSSPTAATTIAWGSTSYTRSGIAPSTSVDIELQWEDTHGNKGTKSNKITQTTDASPGFLSETEDWEGPDTNPASNFWNNWRMEGDNNQPTIINDPTPGGAGNAVVRAHRPRPATDTFYGSPDSRQEPTRRESKNGDIPGFFPFGYEGSFQWRFYLTDDWTFHTHRVTIGQVKPPCCTITSNKPNFSMEIEGQELYIVARWQPDSNLVQNTNDNFGFVVQTTGVNLQKNVWYYVVLDFTIEWDPLEDGMYKLYIKGGSFPTASDIVYTHNNPTAYNTNGTTANGTGVYLKHGIYVWKWRQQSGVNEDDPSKASPPYLGIDVPELEMLIDDAFIKNQHEF